MIADRVGLALGAASIAAKTVLLLASVIAVWWIVEPLWWAAQSFRSGYDATRTFNFYIAPLFVGGVTLIAFILIGTGHKMIGLGALVVVFLFCLVRWVTRAGALFPFNGFRVLFEHHPNRSFLVSLLQTEHFLFACGSLLVLLAAACQAMRPNMSFHWTAFGHR